MELVEQFEKKRDLYNSFAKTISDLLDRLMVAKDISHHSISFRCKTRDSLERKIDVKQAYTDLEDITDLAGVRIITHFSSDVDLVAKMVESEFKIDRVNSIDKRAALDPDRFGYLSLHYVVSLKTAREKLQEYAAFKGLKAEIQIRSILQHTWAEIEHDIGYKSTIEVPRDTRRKFSRMAGLLELADQEFVSIREELKRYQKSMKTEVAKNPEKVMLDKVTYLDFVLGNDCVMNLDSKVAELCNFKLYPEPKNIARQLDSLLFFGLDTVDKLQQALVDNEVDILRRAQDVRAKRSHKTESTPASPGISIFYLTQVLAGKSGDVEVIDKFVSIRGLTRSREFKDYLLGFYVE